MLLIYNGMAWSWAALEGTETAEITVTANHWPSSRAGGIDAEGWARYRQQLARGIQWLPACTDETHQAVCTRFTPLEQLQGPAQTEPDAASVTNISAAALVMPRQDGWTTCYAVPLHKSCQTRVYSLSPSMGERAAGDVPQPGGNNEWISLCPGLAAQSLLLGASPPAPSLALWPVMSAPTAKVDEVSLKSGNCVRKEEKELKGLDWHSGNI